MKKTYDVAVVGAGPGGYVAALRAAQLGFSVLLVDRRLAADGAMAPGGVCLHEGCIPSKALLASSQHYAGLPGLSEHGIQVGAVHLDLARLMQRKQSVLDGLHQGVRALLQQAGVLSFAGTAQVTAPGSLRLSAAEGGEQVCQAKHIILATGSRPVQLPDVQVDQQRILDSSGALTLDSVPERMLVIGASAIGLEMGSVWSRLGAKVHLLEAAKRFLPGFDAQLARRVQRDFKAQGLALDLGVQVQRVRRAGDGVTVSYVDAQGKTCEEKADCVLLALGRRANSEDVGAASMPLACDARGFVQVDAHFQTSQPGVYAIGDLVGHPMLAHKASEQAMQLVEYLAGQSGAIQPVHIPSVIYTRPELARVGLDAAALRAGKARVGRFPMPASGSAQAMGVAQGSMLVFSDADSDRLLAVELYAAQASSLIAEATLALEFGASSEDLVRTVHAHPSLAEGIKEAAMQGLGRGLHNHG